MSKSDSDDRATGIKGVIKKIKEVTARFKINQSDESIIIEQDSKHNEQSEEVEVGVAVNREKGDGENVFEFDFDDVPFNPHIKVKMPGINSSEGIFKLEDKSLLGSNKKECQLYIPHETIAPVHCIIGIKNEKIIIKHQVPDSIFFLGKNIPVGKSFEIPFKKKIKIGAVFITFFPFLPLDISEVQVNRNWAAELEKEMMLRMSAPEEEVDDEELSFFQKVVRKIKMIFLGENFKAKKEDEEDDEELEFDEELYERGNQDLIVENELEASKLEKKNFEEIASEKLDKYPFFIRPFMNFFHNMKVEFSIYENKNAKYLEKFIDKTEKKFEVIQIRELQKYEKFNLQIARSLINSGYTSFGDLEEIETKDLGKILEVSAEEASDIIEDIKNKIDKGELERKPRFYSPYEKEIERAENSKENEVLVEEVAPAWRRLLAFILNFNITFCIIYFLFKDSNFINSEISKFFKTIEPHIIHFFNTYISELDFFDRDTQKIFLKNYKYILSYLIFGILYEMIFGVSLGQFVFQIRSERGFILNRLLGVLRFLIGVILLPLMIFDIIVLFGRNSLKEYVSFCSYIRKKSSPLVESLFFTLAFSSLIFSSYFINQQFLTNSEFMQKSVYDHVNSILELTPYQGIGEPKNIPKNNYEKSIIVKNIGRIIKSTGTYEALDLQDHKISHNVVKSESSFKTLDNSSLVIELNNKIILELYENSNLLIKLNRSDQRPVLYLSEGHMKVNFNKKSKGVYLRLYSSLILAQKGTLLLSVNSDYKIETILSVKKEHLILGVPFSLNDHLSRLPLISKTQSFLLKKRLKGRLIREGTFTTKSQGLKNSSIPTFVSTNFLKQLGNDSVQTDQNIEIKGKPHGVYNPVKDTYFPGPGGELIFPGGIYISPFIGDNFDQKNRRYLLSFQLNQYDQNLRQLKSKIVLKHDNGRLDVLSDFYQKKDLSRIRNDILNQPFLKLILKNSDEARSVFSESYNKQVNKSLVRALARLDNRQEKLVKK